MSDVKFAIVGCGRIAERHAEHINKMGILKAVCDIDYKKAVVLANEYNATAYLDIDELLQKEKDVCVVAICTPNGLHAQHAIKALNAGFHVLCEKPMSNNVNDCGEMIKAAERANKRL
ncbi:MAG TPA: Gfo/Idh/MocA family oxidoreductase, partial [Segetibacter sp.]